MVRCCLKNRQLALRCSAVFWNVRAGGGKWRTIARIVMRVGILQSVIKSMGYDVEGVNFLLLILLLFEKKKISNIRSRKNADCTECSIVLCLNE